MKRRKRVLYPFHYSDRRKLVMVVVRLKNVPGALAGVLSLLTTKVDLIGSTSYSIERETAIFTCMAETLKRSESTDSILGIVKSSPWVTEAEVTESRNGFIVDSFHNGLQLGTGEAYMMVPIAEVSKAFERVVKAFGKGGEETLFVLGKSFGAERFELYRPRLEPNPLERLEEASRILENLGYGASVVSPRTKDSFRFTVEDCFECSTPTSSGRECHFRRGMTEGAFSAMLGRETRVSETRCRLRGDSVCEFTVLLPRA
jgi:predicted hydrocarbon binding protein